MNELDKQEDSQLTKQQFRDMITAMHKQVEGMEGAKVAKSGSDDGDGMFAYKHSFGDGIYARQITMYKGTVLVSKIHKTNHPFFILKGDVSVYSPEGVVRIKAPYQGMTKAGTQRALYIHEDTIWTTCHATDETDLDKIVDDLTAKDYDELDIFMNKDMIDMEVK